MQVKTDLNLGDIAAKLAYADDDEQAFFFDVFFKELAISCETAYRRELQLHSISSKATEGSKECFKVLGFEEE